MVVVTGCLNIIVTPRVYLDKSQHLEDFQLLLTEQTEVEPGSQILLLEDSLLTKHVEPNTPGTSFPHTDQTNPVILFAKNNNSVKLGDERELASFPTLPNLVSVENDATLAKSATAVGYAHKRKIDQCTTCARVMAIAVKQLVEVWLQFPEFHILTSQCSGDKAAARETAGGGGQV